MTGPRLTSSCAMPSVEVHSLECIRELQNNVRRQAERVREELNRLDTDGMKSLYAIKFSNLGYQPVQEDRLGIIAQLRSHLLARA